MNPLFISVIIPALNEESYIARAIETLTPEEDVPFSYEILVLDGGSTDRTRRIVDALSGANPRIRLIDNEKRLQSAGVNKAARLAHPESRIIIRADCHATYPPGFVARSVAQLSATGVQSVVVPMLTVGVSRVQRGIAAAQNSLLGNGGSAHRAMPKSGFVEHGHHAAFDRVFFLSLGGYDERFSHNEDAEFDVRLIRAGGRIWLDAENPVTYYPRSRLGALARQYFKHGSGRARTIKKHRTRPKLRQLAPLFILSGCATGVALGPIIPPLLSLPIVYATICLVWGASVALRARDAALLFMGPAAMTMHMAWAVGFVRERFFGIRL